MGGQGEGKNDDDDEEEEEEMRCCITLIVWTSVDMFHDMLRGLC